MKKLVLSIFFSLFPLLAFSESNNSYSGSGYCTECSSAVLERPKESASFDEIAQWAVDHLFAINYDLGSDQVCENFINEDGYGKLGTYFFDELEPVTYPNMYKGTADLPLYCPNFENLHPDERQLVWFLIFNTASFLESTCGKNLNGKGPNGKLTGLMQLHKGKESKYADGCNNGDGMSQEGSIRCSASMIEKQIERTNLLFSNDSYWAVFRTNIYQYMTEFVPVMKNGQVVKNKYGNPVTKKIKKKVYKAEIIQNALQQFELCKAK